MSDLMPQPKRNSKTQQRERVFKLGLWMIDNTIKLFALVGVAALVVVLLYLLGVLQ